jgi:cholesterol oxidase
MAKSIILAAGTLGSTEILLRSNKLNLSNSLGNNFSTNGDIFGIITLQKILLMLVED